MYVYNLKKFMNTYLYAYIICYRREEEKLIIYLDILIDYKIIGDKLW